MIVWARNSAWIECQPSKLEVARSNRAGLVYVWGLNPPNMSPPFINMLSKEEFSEKINEEILKENLIIVEGKKDLNSLIYIGFNKRNIFILNNGEPFLENVEKINEIIEDKKCKMSILTDLDKKGKLLYSQIKKEIIDKKRIDESFRSLLLMQKISHVEGLSSYVGLD